LPYEVSTHKEGGAQRSSWKKLPPETYLKGGCGGGQEKPSPVLGQRKIDLGRGEITRGEASFHKRCPFSERRAHPCRGKGAVKGKFELQKTLLEILFRGKGLKDVADLNPMLLRIGAVVFTCRVSV